MILAPAFTRERLYMEHAPRHGQAMVQRHINRYKWATSHLRDGDAVFHAGCGSGYGDHILLERAGKIMAADKAHEAIVYAREKARSKHRPEIHYVEENLGTVKLAATCPKFDAVVCIEVIEHLTSDEQAHFMGLMPLLLKKDGKLLITTPLKRADGQKLTEFHEREFDETGFTAFLLKTFNAINYDQPRRFGIPDNFLLAVCEEVKR